MRTSSTTVSRKMAAISECVKEPVFVKNDNNWRLTPLGERLYDIGVKLETSIANLGDDYVSGEHEGEVRVTSLDFINRTVLFPQLQMFHAAHPRIKLNLHSSDANLSLAYGEADLAIRLARPTSSRLCAKKVCDLKCSFYCPSDGESSEWVGLEEELDWLPEMKMASDYFGNTPILRVTDNKAARDASIKLKVAAVLPEIMVSEELDLVKLPNTPSTTREAWLVTHDSRMKDPMLNIVKQWIEDCFEGLTLSRDLTEQALESQ